MSEIDELIENALRETARYHQDYLSYENNLPFQLEKQKRAVDAVAALRARIAELETELQRQIGKKLTISEVDANTIEYIRADRDTLRVRIARLEDEIAVLAGHIERLKKAVLDYEHVTVKHLIHNAGQCLPGDVAEAAFQLDSVLLDLPKVEK